MGVYKKKNSEEAGNGKAVSRRAGSARSESAEAAPKAAAGKEGTLKSREEWQKAFKSFHPAVVDWFKENLDLDLRHQPANFLYDLRQGKMTQPVQVVVSTLAWDRERKVNVPAGRINPFVALMVNLPFKDGKMVAPDKDNPVYVASVPCRPLLERSETGVEPGSPAPAPSGDRKAVEFTKEELFALEGAGVNGERLFKGFNAFSDEEKEAIKAGEVFELVGAVKTPFGMLNVAGEAQLRQDADGKPVVKFQSYMPEEMEEGKVIDLMSARVIGAVELDFFRRDSSNRIIRDVNRRPELNEAGRNLIAYGNAMEPVAGYVHRRVYDAKERRYEDKVEKGWYQVVAVTHRQWSDEKHAYVKGTTGSLYAREMKMVQALNADGTKAFRRDADGKEAPVMQPEIQFARVEGGKVRLDGQGTGKEFAFKTERDLQDYMQGRGGVVSGVIYHDYKTKKDVAYDAFVVADPTRGGFGVAFTPSTSEELIKARDGKKEVKRKKQNFGIGF